MNIKEKALIAKLNDIAKQLPKLKKVNFINDEIIQLPAKVLNQLHLITAIEYQHQLLIWQNQLITDQLGQTNGLSDALSDRLQKINELLSELNFETPYNGSLLYEFKPDQTIDASLRIPYWNHDQTEQIKPDKPPFNTNFEIYPIQTPDRKELYKRIKRFVNSLQNPKGGE